MTWGLRAGVLAAVLAGSGFVPAMAAPSCRTSCVLRMSTCRAERCPGAVGNDRRHCRDVCRAVTGCAAGAARVRTVATVVNECHSVGGMWTGRQRLEIRRGDCPPITVMTIDSNSSAPDPLGICRLYGQFRDGPAAESIGALQGLAVSPDGETVLFQMTDDFVGRLRIGEVTIPSPPFTPPAEGIFVVHADGTGLRRIGDQSREAPFLVVQTSAFPFIRVLVKFSNGFSFSPDGKSVVFSDRGPGADGSDAPQLFTLDPRSGGRRQLTRFTASSVGISSEDFSMDAFFLDHERIGGFVHDSVKGNRILRIRRDGTGLHYIDVQRVPVEGATVVQTFRISGLFSDVFTVALPTLAEQPFPGAVREIFVRNGRNFLQLTHLGRSDTLYPFRSRDRHRIFFQASGDPLPGTNPSLTCQFFSVDVFGRHLRQLTHFNPAVTSSRGCSQPTAEGCTVGAELGAQDPATGAIVFDSSCAAFDSSPVGQQIYAMRTDGSGFRRLTDYRGMMTDSDGGVSVELPGPIAYQAPLK